MSSWEQFPASPKCMSTIPFISFEVGDDFLKYWYQAWEGKLDPFVLVVEGSIPNEKIKKEDLGSLRRRILRPASQLPPMSGSSG